MASVTYLVGLLKPFFSSVSPIPDPGVDRIAPAAEQYFAWLKDSWEITNGELLVNLREVDAAEQFIVDYFTPLLDAHEVSARLTDSSVFGTEALLSVRSSSASLQPTAPLTRVSFTGAPIPNFLLVYAGAFINVHDLLVTKGLPLDEVEAVVSCIMGTILLSSFPVWTVYHELHGDLAFARVRDRLQASIEASNLVRVRVYEKVLALAPATVPTDPMDPPYIVTQLFNVLAAALRKKSGEYLPAFSTYCQLIKAHRTRAKTTELMSALTSQGFWKQIQGQNTTVNFGQVPKGAPGALDYSGQIIYADDVTEKVQDRSFWAPQTTWSLLVRACQLIAQAGFHVYVTAVDNPFAGRHPPHSTHRNGGEVDLIWTFTNDPGDVVPHLAKSKILYGDGPFFDVTRQRFFNVAPLSGGHLESTTQIGLAQLATMVALQAAALAGVDRYLYLDFINMLRAAHSLGLVIDPQLDPFSGGKGNIPVVEGIGHFNHLHIEMPNSGKPRRDYFTPKVLTIIYYLALLRDKDDDFLNTMFLAPPSDPRKEATPAQEKKAEDFRTKWTDASSKMLPSLLPVWVPDSIRRRLLNGEKIDAVLGIGP